MLMTLEEEDYKGWKMEPYCGDCCVKLSVPEEEVPTFQTFTFGSSS